MIISEKHPETAEKITNDYRMIEDGCEGDLIAIIAAALAQAERDGMKRAAEIIQEGFDKEVGTAYRSDGKPSKNDKCHHGFFMYEDCESCCVAAILSEAGED